MEKAQVADAFTKLHGDGDLLRAVCGQAFTVWWLWCCVHTQHQGQYLAHARTSVTSSPREIHTDVDISGTLPIWRRRGSFDAQHEFCVPSLLSNELSQRPANDDF